jgi:hypothetical protein
MSYDETTHAKAQWADGLSINVLEARFHATYNTILTYWFPTCHSFIVDPQGKEDNRVLEFMVICHAGSTRNPTIVVKLTQSMDREWQGSCFQ